MEKETFFASESPDFDLPAGIELPLDRVECGRGSRSRRCLRRSPLGAVRNMILPVTITAAWDLGYGNRQLGYASLEEALHAFTRSPSPSDADEARANALKLERNDTAVENGMVENYVNVEKMTTFPTTLIIQVKRTDFDMDTFQPKRIDAKVDVLDGEFVYPGSTQT